MQSRFVLSLLGAAALLLQTVALRADNASELAKKRLDAGKKLEQEKSFLILGVMPNENGTADAYVGSQLVYNSRLLSSIEFETSQVKYTTNTFDKDNLLAESSMKLDFRINANIFWLKWSPVKRITTNSRFQLSFGPYSTLSFNRIEELQSQVDGNTNNPYSTASRDYREFWVNENQLRASVLWSPSRLLKLRANLGWGLTLGNYYNDYSYMANDSNYFYEEDNYFFNPGWRAGLELQLDFGKVGLRLEGWYSYTDGDLEYITPDSSEPSGYLSTTDTFRFINWQFRAELILQFLKISGASPAVFYSASRTQLEVRDENGNWMEIMSDTFRKTEVIHRWGFLMRF